MNNNIQIRIWANYKDFAEVTERIPLRILPEDYGKRFSPDSFREVLCENYHSFLYMPDAICFNLHTVVHTNRLRDDRVVFTLAVKRGYQLEQNPAEILTTIRKNFIEFINDRTIFYEPDNVNGIEGYIVPYIGEWEDAISVVENKTQILLNQSINNKNIAFVAYDNYETFSSYFQQPTRLEYKGYELVFIVPFDSSAAFEGRQFTKILLSAAYQPRFDVFLTSYSTTSPVATIASTRDRIEVKKEKRYYKPLDLIGSLEDNWMQWKVKRHSDGIGFDLDIPFAAESKTYRLDFNKLPNPFDVVRFEWGTPNTSSSELIVVGDELGKAINTSLVQSKTERYQITNVTVVGDTISIKWTERIKYSVAELSDYVYNKYKFTPDIAISYQGRQISNDLHGRLWWEGNKEDYKITVFDKSGRYEKADFTMGTLLSSISLVKASGIKIKFQWSDDITVDKKHPIVFSRKKFKYNLYDNGTRKSG